MKKLLTHSILFGALLVISQCAAYAGEGPVSDKPKGRVDLKTISLTASVQGINLSNREVTLKGPRGNEVTFVVDERVKRLDEVKVGDLVHVDYFMCLAAELRPPTPEEEKNPIQIVARGGKAPPGVPPAAGALRLFKVVTTVEDIDLPAQTITIKGPRGNSMTVRVEDASRLAKVEKGEHILITFTEALAIALEKTSEK